MTVKNSRLIVEVDGGVVFSQFDIEGETGGVSTLDAEILSKVKAILVNGIGFIEMSPCDKKEL